ncbi:sulfite exporter TauE/SafE family protein [Litorimonas sp. RW-G-Af-16]|uniref:sulfite exporter TauE/SafE family protein n=1 Tax=Litorimonas sp. RW-G-Af-16 TaxID=3241168 RepID=UPI00390CC03F
MKLILAGMFFVTAALYASVGFGGGSTYTALLIVAGTDYQIVPIIALTCNILVVSGNVIRYGRERIVPWTRIWPLIILSVPAAWIGGRLQISEAVFIGLLCLALFIAGVRLIAQKRLADSDVMRPQNLWLNAAIGGGIGFFSGLVGIGGGIFLAPILHFLHWGKAKTIAATCSLFILVNSISGIGGQMAKLSDLSRIPDAFAYWPVIPAVLIGGFIGNHMGVFKISDRALKRLTGVLILLVAIRLAYRWLTLMF